MSDLAISAENLSKRYRIGSKEDVNDTFVGAIVSTVRNPMENLRQLRRLSVFGDNDQDLDDVIWALKDVTFEVKQGEVLGVIGRNGAGKSTLLKILAKITYPTTGRVELTGRVASLLEVGTGFHQELTGRENIYLNGTILGMRKKEIDNKLDEIIQFSGVEKFIDTPVKRYSSGMRVRLAFSVAAHLEPEILLVDEVLAVGDAEFQKKCLGKMDEVARGGRTVLFVSHNMGAINNLCQRVLWLDAGKIKAQGNSFDMVEQYLSQSISKLPLATFPADDEKPMCLRAVELLDKSGVPTNQLSMNAPFDITIRYDINRVVKGAHVICIIRTHEGINIISSGDADTNPERLGARKPGHYKGKFTIPAFLLGEGQYFITLSLGIPFVDVYDRYEDLISFTIVDLESARREFQHQRRPGILGLEIPWTYNNDPINDSAND